MGSQLGFPQFALACDRGVEWFSCTEVCKACAWGKGEAGTLFLLIRSKQHLVFTISVLFPEAVQRASVVSDALLCLMWYDG